MFNYFWSQPAQEREGGKQRLDEGWVELESNRTLQISAVGTVNPGTQPNNMASVSPAGLPSLSNAPLQQAVNSSVRLESSVQAPVPIMVMGKPVVTPLVKSVSSEVSVNNEPAPPPVPTAPTVPTASLFGAFGWSSPKPAEQPKEQPKDPKAVPNCFAGTESYILRPRAPEDLKGFQKLTPFQYVLMVSILFTVFLSWSLFQNWSLLVGASVLTFWAALLGIMVIIFPLYSVRLGKYSLILAFGLGYICNYFGFSPLWMVAFSIVIFIAPAGHFKPATNGDNELSQLRPNKWLSVVLKTMLVQLTGIQFENVDLGASSPSLKCLHIEDEANRPNGFDMIMKYAYDTGSDTHLTVRVPIPVPGYGTATLPVSVAAPCISGNVRLDGRFENCSFSALEPVKDECGKVVSYKNVQKMERFFALALAFDQIDKILIGEIQIMNAPKWEWIQSFETVKAQMKALVNDCLATNDIHVILFDQSFVFIGTTMRKRLRDMNIPTRKSGSEKDKESSKLKNSADFVTTDDGWTVQDVVDNMKVCYKCQMKFLPDFYGCCCERDPDVCSSEISKAEASDAAPCTTATTTTNLVPPPPQFNLPAAVNEDSVQLPGFVLQPSTVMSSSPGPVESSPSLPEEDEFEPFEEEAEYCLSGEESSESVSESESESSSGESAEEFPQLVL